MMPGIAIVCIESVIDLHHYSSEIPTRLISTSIQSKFSDSVEKHLVDTLSDPSPPDAPEPDPTKKIHQMHPMHKHQMHRQAPVPDPPDAQKKSITPVHSHSLLFSLRSNIYNFGSTYINERE